MNAMTHKGYAARVEFDAEDHIFVGRVIGIRDVVTFHGETVSELENAFHEAVDNYLDACASLGQQPNKPYSGKMLIRVSAEIHAAVAASAEAAGKSLNQWAGEILNKAAHV
jgi:predicted HicB family RNase H-like nuclease